MKSYLVRLLLEEYKQACLFKELETMGVDLNSAQVDICNIIFDMVGFSHADSCLLEALYEKYFDVFDNPEIKHKVIGGMTGLKFVWDCDRLEAEKMTDEFVDWLYKERERLPANSNAEVADKKSETGE